MFFQPLPSDQWDDSSLLELKVVSPILIDSGEELPAALFRPVSEAGTETEGPASAGAGSSLACCSVFSIAFAASASTVSASSSVSAVSGSQPVSSACAGEASCVSPHEASGDSADAVSGAFVSMLSEEGSGCT